MELLGDHSYKSSLDNEVSARRFYTWQNVVNQYHGRSLTYSLDFLPALSGMITRMQMLGAGLNLAGLWKENLTEELLWKAFTPRGQPTTAFVRSQPYQAPTWSWASIHNPTKGGGLSACRIDFWAHRKWMPLCHIFTADCIPSGHDRNGAVKSGEINIKGKILSFGHANRGRNEEVIWWLRGVEQSNWCSADDMAAMDISHNTNEIHAPGSLWALVVACYHIYFDSQEQSRVAGLILSRPRDNEETFERVGYWDICPSFGAMAYLARGLKSQDCEPHVGYKPDDQRLVALAEDVRQMLAHVQDTEIRII
jgi:hypothetical protein